MAEHQNSAITAYANVPPDWMPDVQMDRIVTHWTAGDYKASDTDRRHYHVLIEDDGRLVRGTFSISDNVSCDPDGPTDYAAHTRSTNSNCIGVSVCCMKDAIQDPFDAGPFPMLEIQWRVLADVCAQLCKRYRMDVSPKTVLGHGEVERLLGNPQRGKWDPLALPFDPGLAPEDVGARFRHEVAMRLRNL